MRIIGDIFFVRVQLTTRDYTWTRPHLCGSTGRVTDVSSPFVVRSHALGSFSSDVACVYVAHTNAGVTPTRQELF